MKKLPAIFVGHGSPMNAIDDNLFSRKWEEIGQCIPKPEVIVSISAHWYTKGTRVNDSLQPKMIYDMYGFPEELYKVIYNAPGSPKFARLTKSLIGGAMVETDNTWGIDHGTWSVLCRMYPNADIPLFQLSVDSEASPETHYRIGTALRPLREQGVLVIGSGNVVHNLSRVNWGMKEGYPWAYEFDSYIKNNIISCNHENVIQFRNAGASSSLAFTYLDHFAPLLYILGASWKEDRISVFNEACVLGSLSMTSYLFE